MFKLNDSHECPHVKTARRHEAELTSHSHGKKSTRSSKNKDWADMFLARRRGHRNHAYVAYQPGYGSGAGSSRSQDHDDAASHYGSHHGGSGDAGGSQKEQSRPSTPVASVKSPSPAPASPAQPTVPEESPADSKPVPMNDKYKFTTHPGNHTFVQPVSGGRSVRIVEATGYTANGVAHQAGKFYKPSMNPFASHRSSTTTDQGQASDNDPSQAADPQATGRGWGLPVAWGAPDPYGRQYLQYDGHKHHSKHHHHHHRRH
ncbi:hypothetical protein F4811DRAFT_551505 [Daldinia bambusicola]|nr:hypothetical protein F4811DRAFT_551505 [Daldinia bambusicola]